MPEGRPRLKVDSRRTVDKMTNQDEQKARKRYVKPSIYIYNIYEKKYTYIYIVTKSHCQFFPIT